MGLVMDAKHLDQQLLQQQPSPWSNAATSDSVDHPVCIRCLGRFSARVHNEAIRLPRSRQQKPLELLQALIAFGGREVHCELLSQALWPDADGDDAQNAYDVTLHRLRNIFMIKGLFTQRDRKLSLSNELAWVDVWTFERLVNHSEQLLERASDQMALSELMRTGEQLVTLYQGAFLELEGIRPWSISLRERLRSKLLRHMLDAGHILETAGECNTAVRYYLKGLEIEPLAEALYRGLMHCYDRTGQRAEALSAYYRCQKVLEEQLQITPSEQTMALYDSIKS